MSRRLAAVLLALALVACTKGSKDTGVDGVVTYPGLAHTHVTTPVHYAQDPPAGGPHNPVWLRCGVYTQPVRNENAVHSMEHGAVWITYRPGLPQADVDVLHRLQGLKPAYVLISPYPGLTGVAAASAWGLQLKVESVGDKRLAEFVKRYAGGSQGGEPGTRCDNGATPDQIASLSPSPSPTP